MSLSSRPVARLLALIAVGLLAACASGPTIQTETNPSVNLSSYRSFAFFSPLATDKAGYETTLTTRLKNAARRNLEAKGYVYSEADPDLLVNFFVNIEAKQEIRTYNTAPVGYGYYGYRYGYYGAWGGTEIQTVNYKEGTLTIDLVDADRKLLAWQGQAEGRVSRSADKEPGARVDPVVDEIMAGLPNAGQ
jgi:hypothetical protein